MKTNKIVSKKSVNGGAMFSLAFQFNVEDFDLDQIGGQVLNTCQNEANVIETSLQVGDAITDDFGGEPVIAQTHGATISVELKGKENDYRDAFQNRRHL